MQQNPETNDQVTFRRLKIIRLISLIILLAAFCLLPAACAPAVSTVPPETTAAVTPTPTSLPTPTPLPTPSPSPTPAPPITDPAKLALTLTDLPGFTAGTKQSDGTHLKSFTNELNVRWSVFENGSLNSNYKPAETIAFGEPETFTNIEGVLTFRGNNYRNAPTWGTADVTAKKLEVVWTHDIGAISGTGSYWPGAGWTGQPLLVHWPEATRQVMGLSDAAKNKDLVEVFYPVFDGHIYCLDLETGVPTRDPIEVGFAFKGTASVDPRGYPLLYAGQGLNDTNGHIGAFKYRMFNLITNTEIYGIPGKDSTAFRSWGAFDSSTLINWQTDTLLEPGENGLFYKVKLNTAFDAAAGTVSINPEITKLRYKTSLSSKFGIESSSVAYRNLIYFSDNDGNIMCIDINTLEPVWVFNAGDDSDATMVLEETPEGIFLYQGNEMDKRKKDGGPCQLRKINALTGELVWEYDVPVVYESYLNAGLLATPLIGKDDFANMVIFNVGKTTSHAAGTLVAIDKITGNPIWTRQLAAYSWSSPISIKGNDGKSYGIFCDSVGVMHLFDPLTGKDISTVSIGSNCEASPSAYNDMIVVATYSQKIYGIKIS